MNDLNRTSTAGSDLPTVRSLELPTVRSLELPSVLFLDPPTRVALEPPTMPASAPVNATPLDPPAFPAPQRSVGGRGQRLLRWLAALR